MNNLVFNLSIDGVLVLDALPYVSNAGAGVANALSSINFYSIDAENTYYLDDVVFDGDANVGITEYAQEVFNVYPNPTNGLVTIQGEENIDAVVVRDILGAQVMSTGTEYSNTVRLDMSALESGVYFIEVLVGQERSVNRVVKR